MVELGIVAGVHGIGGEIKVYLYGDEEEARRFAAFADAEWDDVTVGGAVYGVNGVRAHKGYLLIRLDGVADRTAAEALRGRQVSVDRAKLPLLGDGEYYEFELIGLKVFGEGGEELGSVKGVLEAGSSAVLDVSGEKYGSALIPVTLEIMALADMEERRLVIKDFEQYFTAGSEASGKGKA